MSIASFMRESVMSADLFNTDSSIFGAAEYNNVSPICMDLMGTMEQTLMGNIPITIPVQYTPNDAYQARFMGLN